jgi:hypothetical protein
VCICMYVCVCVYIYVYIQREDFYSLDEFTAANVLSAARRIRILLMNQPMFGMKGSN